MRRGQNTTYAGKFKKSLKRLSRCVNGEKLGPLPSGNMWYYILASKINEPCLKWKFIMIAMVGQRIIILMSEMRKT